MDGKQLKNSILQWAIQGKLVPQNPKDEPAQKLLERIAASRNGDVSPWSEAIGSTACHPERNAVKSKDLKKKKPAPTSRIYRENGVWYEQVGNAEPKDISDDIPFEIPENWAWCRLNHLTELIEDCPHSTASNEGSGYPLIRTPNIGFGRLDLRGVHRVSEDVYNKRNARAIPQSGDLIFAREAPAGNIAVIQEGEIVCLGQRTVLIRPKKDLLNADYLAFYILSPISQQMLVGKSTGTTVAHVNLADFRPYFIALPPLAEQKRIVAKLEQVLPLAEEYGAAQEQLDKLNKELPEALKKSVLQEAIQGKLVPQNPKDESASVLLAKIRKEKESLVKQGKLKKKDLEITPIDDDEIPFEIPDSWTWCRLGDIVSKLVDGDHNPPSGIAKKTEYMMLSSRNINFDKLVDLDNVRYLDADVFAKENERTNATIGDVLFTSVGTIGRSCVLKEDVNICFQRSVTIMTTYVYNEYLKRYFDSPFYQNYADEHAVGTAQRGFYLKEMEQSLIALPPLAEQKRIVAKLEELFKVL